MTESEMPQDVAVEPGLEMQEEFVSELEDAVGDKQVSDEDKFLMSIDADEEEVGIAKADLDPKDDKTGQGVGEPKTAEEKEEDKKESDSEELEEASEEPEAIDSDELERALSALKRDGLTKELIDKMDNQEILNVGLKRAKVQADADNTYRELSELKKQMETDTESRMESSESEPADQPTPVDLNSAVEPFSEIFGEEAAQALTQVQQAAMQTFEPRLEQMQQGVSTAMAMIEGMLLKSARADLAERFPLMSDDDGFTRVRGRMDSLVKTGEYTDIGHLMNDAARIEFSDEGAAAQADFKLQKMRQKAAGQMTPTEKVSQPGAAMPEEERDDALLTALENGMGIDEAKRLAGA